jgi:hypothetical protein
LDYDNHVIQCHVVRNYKKVTYDGKKRLWEKRKMAIIELTGKTGGRGWSRPLLAPGCGVEGHDLVLAMIPSLESP